MRAIISTFVSIILLVCCHTSHVKEIMQHAESAMEISPDSADKLISNIPLTSLKTEKDKAYYALLKSIISYKQYKRQNLRHIACALSYYQKHNDTRHLQMAYFFYGAISEENGGNWVDCLRKYKEAELLIKEKGNTDLEAYIYKALSNVYYMLGANALSDSYTNKCIALSKIDNDKEQLACLYCTKADLFRRMGLEDSSHLYYKKALIYVNSVTSEEDQAIIYTNYANLIAKTNPTKAFELYKKALYCTPQNSEKSTWNAFFSEKNFEESKNIAQIILTNKDVDDAVKYNVYAILAEKAHTNKLHDQAYKYGVMADSVNEIISCDKHSAIAEHIQTEYNQKAISQKEKHSWFLASCLFILMVGGTLFILGSLHKRNKYQKQLLESKLRTLSNKIDTLSAALTQSSNVKDSLKDIISDKEKKLQGLKDKFNLLRNQNKTQLKEHEKVLTQLIRGIDLTILFLQNTPIKILDKFDRQSLICLHLYTSSVFKEKIYPYTTEQDQVFCILTHLGANRKRLQDVLCLSDDSFRKEKSRLRNKLKDVGDLTDFCDILKRI